MNIDKYVNHHFLEFLISEIRQFNLVFFLHITYVLLAVNLEVNFSVKLHIVNMILFNWVGY